MIERMSFNQVTFDPWTLEQCVRACEHAEVPYLAAWRHKLGDVAESARLLRASGVRLSSLCRGGWFSAPTATERQEKMDDNRRAIEECAAIGSPLLVMVCGPAVGEPLDTARTRLAESLADLASFAQSAGVMLGIEPLHPMYCADRSVVVSLAQANDLAEAAGHPAVGVVIDAFHVWWDPQVYTQIARAGRRILGFHVSDWKVPLPDTLMGRSLMGEGVIELKRLRRATEEAGYDGPIEVEIFNRDLWDNADDLAFERVCQSYREHVLDQPEMTA